MHERIRMQVERDTHGNAEIKFLRGTCFDEEMFSFLAEREGIETLIKALSDEGLSLFCVNMSYGDD